MANWLYTLNTVEEAPFAWNALMERFRIPRGISTQEISPGIYEEVRFASYTDENGAANLPPVNPINEPILTGLNFFRGGYEHTVDDAVRADLIASGVATTANFTLIP